MVESTTRISPEKEPLNTSQETVFKVKFGNVEVIKKVIGSFFTLYRFRVCGCIKKFNHKDEKKKYEFLFLDYEFTSKKRKKKYRF
ncbi:MAG: hypothetical protein ACQERB_05030 [Promethearchaeati archaeon]